MWCPSCHSRSPLVAIQPEGLICARCQVEVEFGDRVAGEAAAKTKVIGPHHSKVAQSLANSTPAFAATAQVAQATPLRLAVGASKTLDTEPEVAAVPSRSRVTERGSTAGADREEVASVPFFRPDTKTSFPSQQPLYRFDLAHPPVGGRTQAAIDLQKSRIPAPAAASTQAAAGNGPKQQLEQQSRKEETRRADSSSLSQAQPQPAVNKLPEQEFALLKELASFADAKTKKTEAAAAPLSEFSLRPVPRSFLFPRRTNRWPGRLCLLSGGLFISGQCLLLYSFLRAEALGVATGILASAGAFALALYMIARYCDEELER